MKKGAQRILLLWTPLVVEETVIRLCSWWMNRSCCTNRQTALPSFAGSIFWSGRTPLARPRWMESRCLCSWFFGIPCGAAFFFPGSWLAGRCPRSTYRNGILHPPESIAFGPGSIHSTFCWPGNFDHSQSWFSFFFLPWLPPSSIWYLAEFICLLMLWYVEIYKNSVQTNHLNTIFSEILAHISKKCFVSDFTSLLSETVFCCFSKGEKGLNQQRKTASPLMPQGFSVLSQLYHQGMDTRRWHCKMG